MLKKRKKVDQNLLNCCVGYLTHSYQVDKVIHQKRLNRQGKLIHFYDDTMPHTAHLANTV